MIKYKDLSKEDKFDKELVLKSHKECKECGELKIGSEYGAYKRSNGNYNLNSSCKCCQKIAKKEYYKENAEKISEQKKEYRKENSEKRKEYLKENAEKIAERKKEYYQENAEKIAEQRKEYRQTSAGKEASARDSHKRRALKAKNGGSYTSEQWQICLEYFDNKCAYTGEILDSLNVEHILAVSKGGTSYIWNLCPSNQNPNRSKNNKDLETWYRKQEYFSEERLEKIYKWQEFAKQELIQEVA